MRIRVPALLAAGALALSLALVVPAGTAEAMAASQTVIESVSPGTSTVAGTPVVPESVIKTTSDVPGSVNDFLPGMLWYGGTATNSIQSAGYQGLTSGNVPSPTNTGVGYSVGLASCSRTFTMDGGGWGLGLPVHITNKTVDGVFSLSQCQTATMRDSPRLVCYNPATGGFLAGADVSHGAGGSQYGPFTKACDVWSNAVGWTPAAYSVAPTPANGAVAIGTDGGYWENPDLADVLGQQQVISIQKTCQTVGGTTTQTVRADGQPGTGVVPPLSCPAGTYPISQKIWSHLGAAGSNTEAATTHVISQTGLASGAAAAYANCITSGLLCDLSVWIDGVRCALLLQGCDKWNDPASVDPAKVQCKWGSYVMPASDCNPLTNCYGVPIDSISNPTAGDPTQCGIDPDEPLTNGPLKPIQGGKIKEPDEPSSSPTSEPTSGGDSGGGATSDPTIIVTVKPTINVTVNPTINVNVPQPTVIVNVPNQGPVDIPNGDGSDCWPSGSAKYNPLDWAYTPMHCALSKLLMPTPGKGQAMLDGIGQDQPFKAWTDAIGDMAGAFAVSAGGCQGPAMNLGYPFHKTLYPASACDEPMATIAKISRAGTGAVLIIGGLWSAVAAILQGIGYNVRSGSDD